MADEKKKPASKKEGKPEAAAEKHPAKGGDQPSAKGPKKASAPPAEGAAPAADAAKPAEGAAAAPVAGVAAPTAAELLADDMAGKKIVKAKGAKNISSGIANILATFNNTLVSITDMQGHVIGWASARRAGFKSTPKSQHHAPHEKAP